MNRLKELRLSHGYLQKDIAKVISKTVQAYSLYELGKREPDNETLLSLSKFYEVSIDYIMNNPAGIKTKGVKIPVLGRIIAGVPLEAIENIEGYEEITPELALKGEYFALKVKGRSMEPMLYENDIVIVRKQEDVESGETAIVLVNGCDATIKKVRKQDNGITLVAYNAAVYEPHFYSKEEIETLPVTIIGKVVESRRSFE